jgi:type 1 glutamine amidotransferase
MRLTMVLLCVMMLAGGLLPSVQAAVPQEDLHKISAAIPKEAPVAPKQPRQVLIFNLCTGYKHSAINHGAIALAMMGERTGAYVPTTSNDPEMFRPEKLRQFDAVVFNNTTGELFEDPELKKSFMDFVKNGGGVVGIHAATDCFYKWEEFGRMMGGYFNGHPWHEKVGVKIDDRESPLTAMFPDEPYSIVDEIYQFRAPYSRGQLRVLLSMDTARTDMNKKGINRNDGDFAISWIRGWGKGRVFYCSLGHREEIFWDPTILKHYLAGIQFATGDLPADITPSAALPSTSPAPYRPAAALLTDGWVSLLNGEDLSGWQGLVGNPVIRAEMSAEELAKAQQAADASAREHWKFVDGVLHFDGKGENLCTIKEYGDFELSLDWKIDHGGDSGVYLRGCPQVQIWDYHQWPQGSGGLYNNLKHPSAPLVMADRPIGEWNTMYIKMVGERVTVKLNDHLVVDNVVMENYWDRQKPMYKRGPIELQSHNSPLWFRNLRIRELPAGGASASGSAMAPDGWEDLFPNGDLSGWTYNEGSWVVEDGVLTRKGGGDIWSKARYGDFILDLEFKLDKETNSGVFFRVGDLKNWLHTAIEMQVLDSYGKAVPDKHDCGAIYDCLAPSKNMVKPAGEWNHATLTCKGPRIQVVLNGEQIIDMDLNQWTEAHKNPDGTPNKFNNAYKDMPREGHLGLQDHGKPVWYRNVRIKKLD